MDILPTILLGLRISYKEDIKVCAVEMVYGTTLRIPGEFFINEKISPDLQIYVEKFREHMRKIRATPTAHHSVKKPFRHKALHICSHVFVKVSSIKKLLEPPYEGPFEVLERVTDHVFKINL